MRNICHIYNTNQFIHSLGFGYCVHKNRVKEKFRTLITRYRDFIVPYFYQTITGQSCTSLIISFFIWYLAVSKNNFPDNLFANCKGRETSLQLQIWNQVKIKSHGSFSYQLIYFSECKYPTTLGYRE